MSKVLTGANKLAQNNAEQKGFTLVELLIVVVILGVLLVIYMSTIGGGTNTANAGAIRGAGAEMARGVGFININLGTGIDTSSSNPLTATGEDMMDVLVKGRASVSSTYQAAYDQLKMRPLQGKVNVRGSGFDMLGYGVSFVQGTSCLTNKVCTQFTNVPSEVVQQLALKEGITYTTTASSANENLHWDAATGGTHTVTILAYP
tara:strand:+ start:84 stop:695 length:612 start_codon:yes stop_codon:yes gene_type:complete